MAYRSSVHESTGFSPYRLMFGEECTLQMDVGLPQQEPDLPDLITSPYAVWVRDALGVAYNQVRTHSGQAVQHEKRSESCPTVVRGGGLGHYYSPAKKCKLDSAWVGPYLVVSLAGWAPGIQRHPDSPIILVHGQDLKKIPRPSGLVSWIGAVRPKGVPTIPVLGASTMGCTSLGSPSVAVLPSDEGAVLADVDSVRSTGSLSGSQADRPDASGVDVSSAALSSAMVPFSQTILHVDVSCDLHPFFAHKLDAGPIWLATIAHAFNYRVAVWRDGVKSATRVGRSRKVEGRILNDTDISWGHHVAVMFQIISALALEVPTFLQNIERLRGMSPDVHLYCEPWGHADHRDGQCDCLSSDRTAAYVHDLALMPRECLPVSEEEFIPRKVVHG